MADNLYRLVIDIYEHGNEHYPVLRHVFYGKDRNEADGYFQAHLSTDRFLRGCVESGHWQDIGCRAHARWFVPGERIEA